MTFKVNDKGQKYEVRCIDSTGHEITVGWADDPKKLIEGVKLHPSNHSPHIFDRRKTIPETITTKHCSKCKQIKSLSDFYKNRSRKDGYTSECKSCQKAYQKTKRRKAINKRYRQSEKGTITNRKGAAKYRKTAKGKVAIKLYRQSDEGKVALRTGQKRFYVDNPNQEKAKHVVNNAIAVGKLPRANTLLCHYCPKPAQQYHHWHGYKKQHWLDVIPVCIPCHKKCKKNIA